MSAQWLVEKARCSAPIKRLTRTIIFEMTSKVCKWDVKPYSSHLCMYVSVGVIQLHVSTWESALRTTISSTVTVVQLGTPAQCAMSVSVALSLSTTRLSIWSGWVFVWVIEAAVQGLPANWRWPTGKPSHTWLRVVVDILKPLYFGPTRAWRKATNHMDTANWRLVYAAKKKTSATFTWFVLIQESGEMFIFRYDTVRELNVDWKVEWWT